MDSNPQGWQNRNDKNARKSNTLSGQRKKKLSGTEDNPTSPSRTNSRTKNRSVEPRKLKRNSEDDSDTRSYSATSKNQRINKAIRQRLSRPQESDGSSASAPRVTKARGRNRPQAEPSRKTAKGGFVEAAMSLFGSCDDDSDQAPASPSNEHIEQSLADAAEAHKRLQNVFKSFAISCEGTTIEMINKEFSELPAPPKDKECVEFYKNRHRNRYQDVFCLESSRVKLKFLAAETGSDYIHANHVDYPSFRSRYILTQGPRKATVLDFWRMVWQEKVSVIVMLCQFIEEKREKCTEYYPREVGTTMMLGNGLLKVTFVGQNSSDGIFISQLRVAYLAQERSVTHMQWTEWPDYTVPDAQKSETVFKLLRQIRCRSTPAVVHCSAGIGRSGTLLAIEMCLMDCLHAEVPQVARAVRYMRLKGRSQAIQSVVQYMAIRKVVLDFGLKNNFIQQDDFPTFTALYEEAVRIAQQSMQNAKGANV